MKKLILLVFAMPLILLANGSSEKINVKIEDSSGKIVERGTIDESGELMVKGLKSGDYTVVLDIDGKENIIGKKPNEKITIPSKGNPKPVVAMVKNPLYQDNGTSGENPLFKGSKKLMNKENTKGNNSSETEKMEAQDYNSSRSNKCSGHLIRVTPITNSSKNGVGDLKINVTCKK